jgi:hypothetical protein
MTSGRLQVITHNLLQLLKKVALPEEYANGHPKLNKQVTID